MTNTNRGTLASATDVDGDGAATSYQLATTPSNATTEAMQAMTNALRFATSKSIRTSTIILASFNVMAALATALGIIYRGYRYSKRAQRNPTRQPSGLFFIHTVEVFPLVLSLGIAAQSVTFAAAQSIGLQALLSRDCTVVAVFLLPALFIAPYIQLVFGVETAVRGFRSHFSARRKWTVSICLGTVATFLLVSLLVAIADRAPDFCFASLFWIIEHYAQGCFVLFLSISVVLIIAIGTIILNLSRSPMIQPVERMAASRMVYYLALGFISNAFVIPFFFSLTFLDQRKYISETLNMSMIASVVTNIDGLMVACLHLFLRSQDKASFGRSFGEYEAYEPKHDPWDNDEECSSTHALKHIMDSGKEHRASSGSVTTLRQSLDAGERRQGGSLTSPGSLFLNSRQARMSPQAPTFPEPTQLPSATSPSHTRKQSYSLSPEYSFTSAAALPAAAYSSVTTKSSRDSFRPPPIVRPWLGRSHRRVSSIESSATVQIGIRLSNVDDFRPSKISIDTERPEKVVRPSPLAQTEESPALGHMESELTSDSSAQRTSTRSVRMKNLPPVPKTCEGDDEIEAASAGGNYGDDSNDERGDADQPITLGPSVYTPSDGLKRRIASDRNPLMPNLAGLRFSTFSKRGNSNMSSVRAPPRPDGSAVTTLAPTTKADWI